MTYIRHVPTRVLRQLRIAAGLSQADLATIANVSQADVSWHERGNGKSLRVLTALAAVLHVAEPWELLHVVGEPIRPLPKDLRPRHDTFTLDEVPEAL